MKIQVDDIDEQIAVCRVAGELDAYTAPDLRDRLDELLENDRCWIVADLTELVYVDSTGLGILVGTAKKCRQAGGDLAVACDRRNVLKIFQISGTQEILNVVSDAEAATERLRDLEESRSAESGEEAT